MLIANHIKLDRFQVSSHRIHGKICKRGKPFNLQSKPYLRAVSEHISKSQLQRETRQQKKHCKTKYSEGKTKKPQAPDSDCFWVHWNQKLKTKSTGWKKKTQIKARENVLTDLRAVKLPNFTEFHLQAEVVSPADSIKDELENLPGSSYRHSLLPCFCSQFYALFFSYFNCLNTSL